MCGRLFLAVILVACLCTINANAAEKSEKIFLGILEPYTDTSWEKEVESDWVRLPFFWDGKNWLAMPENHDDTVSDEGQAETAKLYPEQLKFYAGRADKDGHQVYTLINVANAKFYEDSGLNAPSYLVKAIDPTLPNYMAQDENYCQWNNICKRPLILTTADKQLKEDREGWQEDAELRAEEKKQVYTALKKQFATYNFCANDSEQQKAIEKKWKDDDVNEVKIFRAKNQDLLIGLKLNRDLETCDGAPGEAFQPHWFYLKKSEISYIGKNIMPIEYADYNNDGKTEWIFGQYGYEKEGYILFSDSFKNKLVYEWTYHQQAGTE